MGTAQDLLAHVEALLAAGEWEPAARHVRLGAQQVPSRAHAQQWRRVLDRVPSQQRSGAAYTHAALWVAYRADDRALLGQTLDSSDAAHAAFRAFAASHAEDWPRTLHWARLALDTLPAGHPDRVVATRFHACALAETAAAGWKAAFRAALHSSGPRDRGLLGLEYAYHLIRAGQERAARDVLAGAASDLRGDPFHATLAHANLGISCLRLGDFPEAERALRRAVQSGQTPGGRTHLSTAWRGLGGLYLRRGQHARAAHAYDLALAKAETPGDRSRALRSSALVARYQGHFNDALTLLHDVLRHDGVGVGEPHPAHADLAAVQLLVGDVAGARHALSLVPPGSIEDTWRAGVVGAELRRQSGQPGAADLIAGLDCSDAWARQEAWIFPEVFALAGVASVRPVWSAQVSADGPVQAHMDGVALPLKSRRPAAALLALLVLRAGRVTAERALDALALPGATERARRQELSRAVTELRGVLGWRGAVTTEHGVLTLSTDVVWPPLRTPSADRAESFCEGRYDPWVLEWRDEHRATSEHDVLMNPQSIA